MYSLWARACRMEINTATHEIMVAIGAEYNIILNVMSWESAVVGIGREYATQSRCERARRNATRRRLMDGNCCFH